MAVAVGDEIEWEDLIGEVAGPGAVAELGVALDRSP